MWRGNHLIQTGTWNTEPGLSVRSILISFGSSQLQTRKGKPLGTGKGEKEPRNSERQTSRVRSILNQGIL